jgi:hypothetical protein
VRLISCSQKAACQLFDNSKLKVDFDSLVLKHKLLDVVLFVEASKVSDVTLLLNSALEFCIDPAPRSEGVIRVCYIV